MSLHASLGVDQTAARVQEIVARGEKLLQEGLFFDARVEVQSALKLDPNHPAARRLQEEVQSQQAASAQPRGRLMSKPRKRSRLRPPTREVTESPTEFQPSSSVLSGAPSRSWKRPGLYFAGAAAVIVGLGIVTLGIVAYRRHSPSGQAPITARALNPSERFLHAGSRHPAAQRVSSSSRSRRRPCSFSPCSFRWASFPLRWRSFYRSPATSPHCPRRGCRRYRRLQIRARPPG